MVVKGHAVVISLGLLLGSAGARAADGGVRVEVTNPLAAWRPSETIALDLAELRRRAPALAPDKMVVTDDRRKPVLSQLVDVDGDETPDQLVFQVDLAARGKKVLTIEAGERRPPSRDDFKVYGRFVRERHDDFAWENDRIAHRAYGTGLETWAAEPLVSSGIDVWVKRTRRLVVNDWYMVDDYHRDTGEGADLYSVGPSRGCGGGGVMAGDTLAVSRNFTSSRVLANGPIRLVFELTYAPFTVGGTQVSEVKRLTLDAGKSFNRIESRYFMNGYPDAETDVGVDVDLGAAQGRQRPPRLRRRAPARRRPGALQVGRARSSAGPAVRPRRNGRQLRRLRLGQERRRRGRRGVGQGRPGPRPRARRPGARDPRRPRGRGRRSQGRHRRRYLGGPHLRRGDEAEPDPDRSLALRRGPRPLGLRERVAKDR
jgi:pectinesterase